MGEFVTKPTQPGLDAPMPPTKVMKYMVSGAPKHVVRSKAVPPTLRASIATGLGPVQTVLKERPNAANACQTMDLVVGPFRGG